MIVPPTTKQPIARAPCSKTVITRLTMKNVSLRSSNQRVRSCSAAQLIRARASVQSICSRLADELIAATQAEKEVPPPGSDDAIGESRTANMLQFGQAIRALPRCGSTSERDAHRAVRGDVVDPITAAAA
jgi:hypothetical protein